MSVAMSQRAKRLNRLENDGGGGGGNSNGGGGPPPVKRRKGRPPLNPTTQIVTTSSTITEDDDSINIQSNSGSANWQPRTNPDLKISSIYNRSAPEAPAELFRKDLISAMKLPDSEPLAVDEYWMITDQWKQEWERGVQVPVNPDSLPEPSVKCDEETFYRIRSDFKLPKTKYIRVTKDESFSSDLHYLSNTPALAEEACSYDIDQCDEAWLKVLNRERSFSGLPSVSDEQFERVIEELEVRCWDKIQAIMKNEEGLGIEYDENVICDVCRSPDSEELNEMVFCDRCNICVHQACYGITAIPSGQWLCRTCSMGKQPDCVLCPNKGGAMKSTRSGQKWAHVSCALWIPEVSIGSVDRMEPITKISNIPQSRWALICVLCRERVGACIQCSVKTCKTAYHVTCAFQHGLEMRAIIEDENAEDGVKLRSYCLKHSMNKGKKDGKLTSNNNQGGSGSDEDDCKRKKQKKDMTSEERNQARIARLAEVQSEFDKHVNIKDISCHLLDVDQEAIHYIYNYWILKRKSLNNHHLLPPKTEDVDMISQKQEQADIEKMKKFVHLRQDLERVRNLCYMVSRREKLSRSFFKMREQTFHKQVSLLINSKKKKFEDCLINAVIKANHGPSIYDQFYSSENVANDGVDLDEILSQILGSTSPKHNSSQKLDINGVKNNKHLYINGLQTGSTTSGNVAKSKTISNKNSNLYSSSMSSNDSDESSRPNNKAVKSSNDDDDDYYDNDIVKGKKKSSILNRNKGSYLKTSSIKGKKKTKVIGRKPKYSDSSSDDEAELKTREKKSPRNRTLIQMEKELAYDRILSGSESDELLPIRSSHNKIKNNKFSTAIYSDSDSTDKDRTDNTASDSQLHTIRTKAAMKEFIPQNSIKNTTTKSNNKVIEENLEKVESNKIKPKDIVNKKLLDFSSDFLVVPQRQAAKKASENLKSSNSISTSLSTFSKKDVKIDEDKVEKSHDKETIISPVKDVKDKELPPKEVRSRGRPVKSKNSHSEFKKQSTKSESRPSTTVKTLKDEKKEKERLKEREKMLDREREKEKDQLEKEREREREKERERERERDREKEREREIEKQKLKEKERIKEKERLEKEKEQIFSDADLIDKIAYVPQRQAAKKAAEHIKSGLGKPVEVPVQSAIQVPVSLTDEKSKPSTAIKKDEPTKKPKASISISSSSCSDSSYSSSSSSDSDESVNNQRPNATTSNNKKIIESKNSNVLPFLDKGTKTSTSLISSDDSTDSIKISKEKPEPIKQAKKKVETTSQTTKIASSTTTTPISFSTISKSSTSTVSNPSSSLSKKPPSRRLSEKRLKNLELEQSSVDFIKNSRVVKSVVDLCEDDVKTKEFKSPSPTKSSTQSNLTNKKSSAVDKRRSSDAIITRNSLSDSKPVRTTSSSKSRSIIQEDKLSKSKTITVSDEENKYNKRRRRSTFRESSPTPAPGKMTLVEEIINYATLEEPIVIKDTDSNLMENIVMNEENVKPAMNELLESKWEVKPDAKEDNTKVEPMSEIENEPDMIEREPEPKIELEPEIESKIDNKIKTDSCDDVSLVNTNNNVVVSIELDESDSENKTEEPYKSPVKSVMMDIEEIDVTQSTETIIESSEKHKDDKKSSPKLYVSLRIDEENNKSSDKSSIFSPSPSPRLQTQNVSSSSILSKDGPTSFFDFNDDLLSTVSESATDVSFGISRDSEEIFKTNLPFSFGDDVLFKEDCKEDSARETLFLVEKLRQNKYKKQTSVNNKSTNEHKSDSNTEPVEMVIEPPLVIDEKMDSDMQKDEDNRVSDKFSDESIIPLVDQVQKEKTDLKTNKLEHAVTIPSDERWVPPSGVNSTPFTLHEEDTNKFVSHKNASPLQQPSSIVNKFSLIENQNNDKENLEKLNFGNTLHSDQTKENMLNSSKYDDILTNSPLYNQHQSKWSESQMITTRRSVSSSPPSSGSESVDDHPISQVKVNNVVNNNSSNNNNNNNNNSNNNNNTNSQHEQLLLEQIQQIQPDASLDRAILNEFAFNHIQQHTQQNIMSSFQQQLNPIPTSLDSLNYNYQDSSQFISPVSLFPPTGMNTQLPFPSPGAALFPPSFSQSFGNSNSIQQQTHIQQTPVSKTNDLMDNNMPCFQNNPCSAAFTSSSHNLALTAAIVSPPTSRPGSLSTPIDNSIQQSVMSNLIENPLSNVSEGLQNHNKTSPANGVDMGSKLIRSSPRFINQQQQQQHQQQQQQQQQQIHLTPTNKSPSKSPGKSPRQMMETTRQQISAGRNNKTVENSTKQTKSRSRTTNAAKNRSARGRNRGGRSALNISNLPTGNEFEFHGTIHNKLVGTVYDLDFDEDIAGENNKNLKLRDRRRSSIDCRLESFRTRDSPQSPKFMNLNSTQTNIQKSSRSSFLPPDVRELRPPSPIHSLTDSLNQTSSLHDIVHPVLPGPVDMRTYSSDFDSTTTTEAYNNNLLGAFASGTADQTIQELDEEMEKELQSALKASTTKPSITVPIIQPLPPPVHHEEYSVDQDSIKVSLSDSRNQLKLKIKGPLAHPDYTSSTVTVNTQQIVHQIESVISNSHTTTQASLTAISNTSGPSSLRRMRKKELLRQYWTQDMNMDDATMLPQVEQPSNLIPNAPINRSVGIPKAIDSMSSIPTKEDYKDYTLSDLKKRKKISGISARELQQLDISFDNDLSDRRNSISDDLLPSIDGFNNDSTYMRAKRRTRIIKETGTTKLKIKIGGANIIETQEDKRISGRPLKKRIPNLPMPSLEDLRRDSMNFRKEVMAEFEQDNLKKSKKSIKKERREEKKKRKKEKLCAMQMVQNTTDNNPPKLIIRIGKRKAEVLDKDNLPESKYSLSPQAVTTYRRSSNVNEPTTSPKPLVPIRLKITKNSEGSRCVMSNKETTMLKETVSDDLIQNVDNSKLIVDQTEKNNEKDPLDPEPDPPPSTSKNDKLSKDNNSFPQNKDCEVR